MTPQGATNSNATDAKNTAQQLHLNWDHASAHQLTRILVYAEGANYRLWGCVGEVATQCEARPACEKAAYPPTAGTSSASFFNEKIQAGLCFLGDVIARHVADARSKYSLLARACSKSPLEV